MIQHKKITFLLRCVSVLLIITMMFSALASSAYAMGDYDFEEVIVLDGEFTGRKFYLHTSGTQLFDLDKFAPGDIWTGRIKIKNKNSDKMLVSVRSIVSNIEDTLLFETLDLEISSDGEMLYSGSYAVGKTKFITLKPRSTKNMDITVTLPPETGNALQGKVMKSTWTIEARYYEDKLPFEEYEYRDYTVQYLDSNGKKLLPDKVVGAVLDSTVTEKAPEIKGYKVDQETKSIVIKNEGNLITFIYTPVGDSVSTGVDLPGGTDNSAAIFAVLGLVIVGVAVIGGRIYFIKRKLNKKETEN